MKRFGFSLDPRAAGPAHNGPLCADVTGFQPFRLLGPFSWAFSPGWYFAAPLALEKRGWQGRGRAVFG